MSHERFIDTFEQLGFHVKEEEPPAGEERGAVLAENTNGDELWWSVIDTPEVWGVYIDPASVTLDSPAFQWEDLDIKEGGVVIDHATGTRTPDFGYGRRGFEGEVQIDKDGVTITEQSQHRL